MDYNQQNDYPYMANDTHKIYGGVEVIIGLIVILMIPFIFYFISSNDKTISVAKCEKIDDKDKLITHVVNSEFKGKKLDKIEYILEYDIISLDEMNKESIRNEEDLLGKKYIKNSKLTYKVIEDNDIMALHIYGSTLDVEEFYSASFGSNKDFFMNSITDRGYVCEID